MLHIGGIRVNKYLQQCGVILFVCNDALPRQW